MHNYSAFIVALVDCNEGNISSNGSSYLKAAHNYIWFFDDLACLLFLELTVYCGEWHEPNLVWQFGTCVSGYKRWKWSIISLSLFTFSTRAWKSFPIIQCAGIKKLCNKKDWGSLSRIVVGEIKSWCLFTEQLGFFAGKYRTKPGLEGVKITSAFATISSITS